jgi:putative inorganic carbon (HCO3(-)) transporter
MRVRTKTTPKTAWLLNSIQPILNLEWLGVALAAPLLLFPTLRPGLTAVALVVLAALWLLCWFARGEPWPVTLFNGALLLFAITIPVAVWASAFPPVTLPKATGLVLGLAAFRALVLAVRDRRSLSLAVTALCLVGGAIVAVGLAGVAWPAKVSVLGVLTERIPRLIASLPGLAAAGISPNQLAGALTLYLPLAVALAWGWRHFRRESVPFLLPAANVVFACLVAGALVLTQSRSGWIGGAAGLLSLVTLWGLSDRRRWMRALSAALPALALVIVLVVLLYVGPEAVGEALYGVTEESIETVAGVVSLQGRIEIWNRALYAIQDFPFTGCGLGTFRRVVHILYPLFLIPPDTDVAHAHNIFLQTALDLGLPGLIAYLALLGIAMTACWRCAHRGGPLVRATALGLAAGLVGLHVYGLADAVALGSKPGVAFWFALGLTAALPNVARQAVREPEKAPAKQAARITPHVLRFTRYARAHPWLLAAALLLALALLVVGVSLIQSMLPGVPSTRSDVRLPLYPAAQGVEVRTEAPPADTGWVGALEIATFTTTHPITDVAGFYTDVLVEAGWEAESEAGDETGWGGIYTQEGGLSVCLLNAFDIEGQTWISIVCGDKAEPVDVPSLP